MKHVVYAGKSMWMDGETTDVLLEYAGTFGPESGSDTVSVRAISADGNRVEVTFLLNAMMQLVAESADGDLDLPKNDVAIAYMRERLDLHRNPRPTQPETGFESARLLEDYDDAA